MVGFFPSTIFTSFAYRFLNQFNHPGGSFLYELNKCVNSINIFIEHHVLNFWNYVLIVDTKLSSSERRCDILQSRNLPKMLFQYLSTLGYPKFIIGRSWWSNQDYKTDFLSSPFYKSWNLALLWNGTSTFLMPRQTLNITSYYICMGFFKFSRTAKL